MKVLRIINLIAVFTFLVACGSSGVPGFPTATSLPPPGLTVVATTDPALSLQAYFEAFKVEDYNTMYNLLSKVTRDTVTLEDFAIRNRNALNEMSAGSFDYEVLSALVNPYSAELAFRITYHTALVGDLQREIIAKFALEDGEWKLNWDDALILPELAGGNVLKMNYSIPARGNIYDKDGEVLAAQSEAYAFYVIPGNVTEESLGTLLSEAWLLCGISQDLLAEQIFNTPAQFPIPLCEASEDESQRIRSIYPSGLAWDTYTSRYYFKQGTGSNVLGYTQQVPAELLEEYRRRGYQGDEYVGRAGIEQWAEDYLSGVHGGELYVIIPSTGAIVTKVGESAPKAADAVYLTLDRNLQYYAEQAIQGLRGAVVVMEVDTGRVLAMATSPDFDANIFSPGNSNASAHFSELQDGAFINRATQGQYPLGSVFKIITMAAAMESGLYIPERTYDCQYEWTRLPDRIRYDWTYQHCQDRLARGLECNTTDSVPSGVLTLSEGLMRSCNPYFWEMGYDLFQNSRANDIANMARAFGLGQSTGIEQILEEPGQIDDPATDIDVVNQAIGQGTVQVTPLQVARFIAALGNGGTLYRPQLVEKIVPVDGSPEITIFTPTPQGTLPVQPFRLDFIRDSMISVVSDPDGTAYFRLRGLAIPVAGKTGTAESGSGNGLPHAWFAGYTLASESTNLPDIAIAVIIENIGEGSDYAAPVFKRIVETYYYGEPRSLYWFESSFGVTETPTPLGGIPTETPEE